MKATRTDPSHLLRMPEDLKARLKEQADAAGRSLNTEIIQRLEASLARANSAYPPYNSAGGHLIDDSGGHGAPDLTNIEEMLLAIFRKMTVDKQLALLSLFK